MNEKFADLLNLLETALFICLPEFAMTLTETEKHAILALALTAGMDLGVPADTAVTTFVIAMQDKDTRATVMRLVFDTIKKASGKVA